MNGGNATDPRFAEVCQFIGAEMPRLHIPGVALGIVDGAETYTAGFGVTKVENPLPVNEDTLFQIGSTTKTVTATAASHAARSLLVIQ